MRLRIDSNIDQVLGFFDRLHPQASFATAKALTQTAQEVQKGLYAEMDRVWDRPTPFSKRSLFVKPATKANLTASVEIKDRFPSGATRSPEQIYRHQYFGGKRERKGLERFAQAAGLISADEVLVPASGARLDQYGNMQRGQIVQIMSQLRLGLDPYSFKTTSRRSKANQKKAGLMFWSRGGHLERGVWVRRVGGVQPVMVAVQAPAYSARMDIDSIGSRITAARFELNLERAWSEALATMR